LQGGRRLDKGALVCERVRFVGHKPWVNAMGQLVTEGTQKKRYGADATIDITTLPKGVYFLRTKLEGKIKVHRFVKE
jgi:hypothetical protein